jgi:Holliday junction resolvasome RuvABC endonuclease subunit
MNILALDCATKTGWCLWGEKFIESGVEDFSKRRGESNGSMFLRFRHWLKDMIAKNNVGFVIYEQSHHRGGAATEVCVNLTGRVQELCSEFDIEYATVHTATLKKFATGSGKADKVEMIKAAAVILGRQPVDDNEADAVLLMSYGSEVYA